ncbi:MAG: putative CocE/NonD family hydrolase [Gammaproteobacteria bacterium]|jgi:putative CocE/NonD family hydrolase
MEFTPIDGARGAQSMVRMRDGTALNTFVYLPPGGGPRYPVIVHRTPYGITNAPYTNLTDYQQGWLPSRDEPMRGSILRGWRAIVEHGYAAVYQDTRGRYGSEGEDVVYGADAEDGHDLLEWIANQPWSNQRVGLSGSSAGATTALAAAAGRHPSIRAFFAQVGGSSIYDDVVYEGQSIEMERLWLWVAKNIPGLSQTHRDAAARRGKVSPERLGEAAVSAAGRYEQLNAARAQTPPFVDNADWCRLPLLDYPDFTLWQPYLNEILSHPMPDEFRARHNFRRTIEVPGFHVTTWYDIFQTSVIKAFTELQERVGNQRLWVGPNDHYFVYQPQFWQRDPYFEWFDLWLRDEVTPIAEEPPVFYSPRSWVANPEVYQANDWRHAASWPPPNAVIARMHFCADGRLTCEHPDGGTRTYRYDPNAPVPTAGGRNMLIGAGAVDQRTVQDYPDYGLIYASHPLTTDLVLAGPAAVGLEIQSDRPDTDFVAKLIELKSDGAAILLMDGVVRAMLRDTTKGVQPLSPDTTVAVRIELGDICHTLTAGSCVRVDVTSSNFPRRARNTNSGHLLLAADDQSDVRVATNTILHDAASPSWLDLTILGVGPILSE